MEKLLPHHPWSLILFEISSLFTHYLTTTLLVTVLCSLPSLSWVVLHCTEPRTEKLDKWWLTDLLRTNQLSACSCYKHITHTESSRLFTCDLSLSCQPTDFLNIPDGMRDEHRAGNMITPSSTPIILLMQYETYGT